MNNPAMTIKGEQAKKQLIAAALAQFGEYGMNATTREIAAQAGQNIAAITYYFGSKKICTSPAPSGLLILLASSSVRTPKKPNVCSRNHSRIRLPSVN